MGSNDTPDEEETGRQTTLTEASEDEETCLCETHDGDLGCFEHYEVED